MQGGLTFPGGKVKVVKPVAGATLSVAGTADAVAARWPATAPIATRVDTEAPAVSAEEVDRANTEFAHSRRCPDR